MLKKIHYFSITQIIMVILGIILICYVCFNSNQAMHTFCIPQKFCGEYSLDNGKTWEQLDENTSFSALDGNLILRGNFEYEFFEGAMLNFYLNHINMNIYVNGELSFIDSRTEMGLTSAGCCKQWLQWVTPEITKDDIVEIYLENPHKFGNKNAYNELLSSIYGGSTEVFRNFISKEKFGLLGRIIGFIIMIVSVMLLAVSLAFRLMKIEGGKSIGNLGFLALFSGGYFILDTIDISFWSYLNAFNTYGVCICIGFATFYSIVCMTESMKSNIKKVANIIVMISAITNIVLLLISLFGVVVIYDTGIYWISIHSIILMVLLICCIYEFNKSAKEYYIQIISNIIFIVSILIDMLNVFTVWLPLGVCSKIVFVILFLLNVIRTIKTVTINYQNARQAEKMKSELADSRISIMLSQIKPHFIYNILNTIYYLCEKDIKLAQRVIVDFSDYLRGNMDSLSRNYPVPFHYELEHLKRYLSLEKLRFDDMINIVYDIQTEDFMIPTLTIQPLVENAIKHGICKLENGGTVEISTRECKDYFEVKICDNGVGFDINEVKNDGRSHIGIENVRNRLWKMSEALLEITSEKNNGTTVIIKIPKNRKFNKKV